MGMEGPSGGDVGDTLKAMSGVAAEQLIERAGRALIDAAPVPAKVTRDYGSNPTTEVSMSTIDRRPPMLLAAQGRRRWLGAARARAMAWGRFQPSPIESGREQQLDAVAPRVLRVEPPDTGQRIIPNHQLTGISQTLGKHVELTGSHTKRWMRLARGREAILYANVKLLLPTAKPDSAAPTKRLGLLDLHQAKKVPVEPPRLSLAASRSRHLHMIEAHDAHHPKLAHHGRASTSTSA
jgi:hypothetical protein